MRTVVAIVLLVLLLGGSPRSLAQSSEPAIAELTPVSYARNLAAISDAGLAVLDDAAVRVQQTPGATLLVDGHADETERFGVALTRAEIVRHYLVDERGIEPDRVLVRFFDDRYPRGDAAENRRVEIYLLAKDHEPLEVSPARDRTPAARAPWSGPARPGGLTLGSPDGPRPVVRAGHTGAVLSVAFSPDAKLAVTGGSDAGAKLWQTATGIEVQRFAGHTGPVFGVAFSHKGDLVATASADGTASLWNPTTGAELRRLEGHTSGVTSVCFSADDRFLLTGSRDGTARVWSVATGAEVQRSTPQTGAVEAVAFTPDGSRFLAAGDDGVARVWDTTTGAQVFALVGHTGAILAASVASDGRLACTASDDGTIRCWSLANGASTRSIRVAMRQLVAAAFSPDGRLAVVGDGSGATLWDLTAGRALRPLDVEGPVLRSARFSADGGLVATGGDRVVRILDAATGIGRWTLGRLVDAPTATTLSADGRLLVAGLESEKAAVFAVREGRRVWALEHDNAVVSAQISPDDRFLATAMWASSDWCCDDAPFLSSLWDLATGAPVYTPGIVFDAMPRGPYLFTREWRDPSCAPEAAIPQDPGSNVYTLRDARTKACVHTYVARSAAISPDGKLVLTGQADGSIAVHRSATGEVVRAISAFSFPVDAVSFAEGGQTLVASSTDERVVRAWGTAADASAWSYTVPLVNVDPEAASQVEFYSVDSSPDGRYVVVVNDASGMGSSRTHVLSAATGAELWTVDPRYPGTPVEQTSRDGSLRLSTDGWEEGASGTHVSRVGANAGDELWAANESAGQLSPDGRFVLTRSADGAGHVRDATTGREVWRAAVSAADYAFSMDGRFVLASNVGDGVAVLDAATGREQVRLFFFTDGSWAALDAEGKRFDASDPGALRGLAFVNGIVALPSDEAARRFRTPGLLARLLK